MGFMVVIEHVRHRVVRPGQWPIPGSTRCGRRFMGLFTRTRDTEHHQPQRSRCPECYR